MAGLWHDTGSSGEEAHGKLQLHWIDIFLIQPPLTSASVAKIIDPKYRLF